MRISKNIVGLAALGLVVGLGISSALALDAGHPANDPVAPVQCTAMTRPTDIPKVPGALQYQAEQGNPVAQWKLGHMYAKGDGVPR